MTNNTGSRGIYSVGKLIAETRQLAAEYRRTTGLVLGVSSEIARFDACQHLQLEPSSDANSGFDAIGKASEGAKRYQIKARVIFDESKKNQRIGQLKLEQDWDSVLLVLMDENYETDSIYEAERAVILEALDNSKQSNRSKRGLMSVSKFKNIAKLVWTREEGIVEDEIWDNQAGS